MAVAMTIGEVDAYVGVKPQLLNTEVVVRRETEVLLSAQRLRGAEDVAIGSKGLCGRAVLVLGIAPRQRGVKPLLPSFVLVLATEVEACHLRCAQSLRHLGRCPLAIATGLTVLVDIVGIAKERQACVVVVVEREESSHVTVVGTCAGFDIPHEATVIVALEHHVHHVVLALHIVAYALTLTSRLVVDLQLLHGEVRQVVEHHLVLATEEVLAVEQQIVHLSPVDIDVAILLQLSTRHLTDESVEHRSVGQVEGRCIVDNGVATIGNLHPCARDDHAVEAHLFIDVLPLLQQQVRQTELVVAGKVAQGVVDVTVLIALARTFYYIVSLTGGNLKLKKRDVAPHKAGGSVDNG